MNVADNSKIQRLNSQRFGFVAFYIVLFLISTILVFTAPTKVSSSFVWLTLGVVGIILVTMLKWKLSEPRPTNWMTPETIFTGSFIIVHFLYMFIWNSSVYDTGDDIWYFRGANCPDVVCKTLAMCAACLAAFHAGYHIVKLRPRKSINELLGTRTMARWQYLGKFMTRLSLLILVTFIVLVGPQFLSGVYTGTRFSFLSAIMFQVFQGMIVASIGILILTRASFKGRTRRVVFLDTILIVIAACALLLHGDRSTFLVIFVAFAAAFSEFIKPIKIQTAFVALIGLFFLFGISALARHAGERTVRVFIETGREKWGDSLEYSAKQFGSSVLCAFVAVDHVPSEHDYYLGKLKTNDLAGTIPFGRKLFGISQTKETSSSMLFTHLIQGRTGQGVAGTGSSVFGDVYLEFGFWGTAVVFCMLGALFKFISEKSKSTQNLGWKVALICLIAILSISGRFAILGLLVRHVAYPAMYTIFIAYCLGIHTRIKLRRSGTPSMYPVQSS